MRPGARKAALAGTIVVVALLLAVGAALFLVSRTERVELDPKLVVIEGGGGNSTVLVTPEGSVVVDTKLSLPASRLFEEAKRLGGGKVRAVINTHHHWDHSHGNPLFPKGTDVFAAAPVSQLMLRFDADFWRGDQARALLPNKPVDGELVVDFGDERVRLVQLPAAHTGGGDIAVLFENHRVLAAGDIYFHGIYPVIDLPSGGSVPGYIQAIDRILQLPFDQVVPGHGPVAKRADLLADRGYFVALWDYAQRAVRQGLTPERALAEAPAVLRTRQDLPLIANLQKNLAWAMEEAARAPDAAR